MQLARSSNILLPIFFSITFWMKTNVTLATSEISHAIRLAIVTVVTSAASLQWLKNPGTSFIFFFMQRSHHETDWAAQVNAPTISPSAWPTSHLPQRRQDFKTKRCYALKGRVLLQTGLRCMFRAPTSRHPSDTSSFSAKRPGWWYANWRCMA